MAAAYAYAEGGPLPDMLEIWVEVDRYGVQAVFGRPLSFHEIRMRNLAYSVIFAYREREKSDNWAKWAQDNPEKSQLLAEAGRLAQEE